jgi:hypothetical protein
MLSHWHSFVNCGPKSTLPPYKRAHSSERRAPESQTNSLTHRSSCVYHPAPLTKQRASSSETPERLPSIPASSNRASPYPSRMQQPVAPISPSSLQEESSATTRSMSQPSPMLPMTLGTAHGRQMSSTISHKSPENFTSSFRNNNGFLGPTAYSAVFTENSGKWMAVFQVYLISASIETSMKSCRMIGYLRSSEIPPDAAT